VKLILLMQLVPRSLTCELIIELAVLFNGLDFSIIKVVILEHAGQLRPLFTKGSKLTLHEDLHIKVKSTHHDLAYPV